MAYQERNGCDIIYIKKLYHQFLILYLTINILIKENTSIFNKIYLFWILLFFIKLAYNLKRGELHET
jgi:hypothetical protein